jgi:hypothetical protein
MLTIEERERRAYISGNVELAAALAAGIGFESGLVEELEHDNRMLSSELSDTCDELNAARDRIAELEAELEDARA